MTILRIAGLLGAVVVVIVLAGIAWLAFADLRPAAQAALARALDRRVAIDALTLGWHDGPELTIRNLSIANPSGYSAPDMLRLSLLQAQLDWRPLLRGVLQYRRLRAEGLVLELERVAGRPNWRFAGGASGFAIIPRVRSQFPTLIDARIRTSLVRYHGRSGAVLAVGLGDLAITAASEDQPATFALDGSYNGTPARITIDGGSFATFRRRDVPYPAHIALAMAEASLAFDGTFMRPLDGDGADGALSLQAGTLETLLAAFGVALPAHWPARLEGTLHRDGDDWRLAPAQGALGGSDFTGALALKEGAGGAPDAAEATLAFDRLGLDPLLAGAGGDGDVSLARDPGATRLQARLSAAEVAYGAIHATKAVLDLGLEGDHAELRRLAAGIGGGQVTASASLQGEGRLTGEAAMEGLDLAAIAAKAGAGAGTIGGRLDGRLVFDLLGPTLPQALRGGTIQAAVGMTGGHIARSVLEQVSADLRSIFRHAAGTAPVSCLLAVMDVHNGTGRLAPVRLRSAGATLAGAGVIDLTRHALDLTIQSEDTGFFALDVPVRIAGPITSPHASAAPRPPPPVAVPGGLAPPVAGLAMANPCRG